MTAIDKIKAKLASHPELRFSEAPSFVEVIPPDTSGFAVRLDVQNEHFTVSFEGWHEDFESEAEALECFAFGLSEGCRLAVAYRGDTPSSWTLEGLDDGRWVPDSTTGRMFVPFWKSKRVVYRQNHVIAVDQLQRKQ